MGMTLIIAILGVLLGGGVGFLANGGIGVWMGVIYGFLVGLMVLGAMLRDDEGWLWPIITGLIVGVITYYVAGGIVNWSFQRVYETGVTNPWLLALIGGIVSDILFGIVVGIASLIVASAAGSASRYKY